MPTLIDILGQRYGRLVATEYVGRGRWLFICDCGQITEAASRHIRAGKIVSCGCFRLERVAEAMSRTMITHGGSRKSSVKHLSYLRWLSMMGRSGRPSAANRTDAHLYWNRGIFVCERWLNFENFFDDMGECPGEEYTLERKDNNKGYEAGNCIWATRQEQACNRRPRS